MFPSERDAIILDLIQRNGIVTVSDICTQCNCSKITARRDLRRLEDQGLLRRIHGGATRLDPPSQSPIKPNGRSLLEARTALTDRADVLIVTPWDTKATRLLVERAHRAGVPIIAESINYQEAVTFIAVDNYRAGLEAGRWVANYARQHQQGKVNALDVCQTLLPNTEARSRGFADGLRELPTDERNLIRVNGQGLRETARRIVADALTVHPEINVIFGINDDSALGALDAYRTAGLDESRLLLVPFGLEGNEVKKLMEQGQPYTVAVAMFPEIVGRACIDAAICAYHRCPLPERIITPFAIVTPETLARFYQQDECGKWSINWAQAEQLPTANTGFTLLRQCNGRPRPKRIGYVEIYSTHEWYQNVRRTMQELIRPLGICLEVVDASQDMAQEVDELKRVIGYTAAHSVREGDTIILDAGVATTYLARALACKEGITVITNSLSVLEELKHQSGITLMSSGGVVRQESQCLVGPGAEATFRELRAGRAFIATTGLSLDFGLSNTNLAEASVKQAMIGAARETILLADHTKIGTESLVKIAPIERVHRLITDAGISDHDRLAFTERGIEVTIAEEEYG